MKGAQRAGCNALVQQHGETHVDVDETQKLEHSEQDVQRLAIFARGARQARQAIAHRDVVLHDARAAVSAQVGDRAIGAITQRRHHTAKDAHFAPTLLSSQHTDAFAAVFPPCNNAT